MGRKKASSHTAQERNAYQEIQQAQTSQQAAGSAPVIPPDAIFPSQVFDDPPGPHTEVAMPGGFAGHAGSSALPLSSIPGTEVAARKVPWVPPPNARKLSDAEFYTTDQWGNTLPNVEDLKIHFFKEGRLCEHHALWLIEHASTLLKRDANLVHLTGAVTICGDIHGQYYDLMKLFEVGGKIGETTFCFLGDYVDRGNFGIECLLYLYALKMWWPKKFILLRGNHECRHLTEYFTFKRECLHKYSSTVYEACIASFNCLPVSALVDRKFLCVHGGISPDLHTLKDIEDMDRFKEPGSHGLLCDLLWADPISCYGTEQGSVPRGTMFVPNSNRGCSYSYTYDAVCSFLDRNGLLSLVRGHEAQDAGYTMYRKSPSKKFPSLITIFSAPNYLDVYHNRAAVLKYENRNITIRQYNASPHPFWLPNFMNAFTWSLPFVGAKITEMLLAILSICSQEELVESEEEEGGEGKTEEEHAAEQLARRQAIKNKILAVGRMQRVFQLLREEAENQTELIPGDGGPTVGGPDVLNVQGSINRSIKTFDDARRSDLVNERLPSFETVQPAMMFPTPSMRVATRLGSDNVNMEMLIRKALAEDLALDDGGVVERLAERIARGRVARPAALKRHGTA
ncbi:hypothetical protein AGABI1DRAFT_76707 [Agaricus bisporus var. burnettii JB137-S8]|nr:uncharacterized protein AGABI1DRAFT_76707 [Agaricus bisporus var. burnettii JB137-S8]EKM77729.1 hypothetical protein AGABI1DRAFT_76707 [Agaricus bisporus var. burnettii JB137-S8]